MSLSPRGLSPITLFLWKTRPVPLLLTAANPGPLTGRGNNTWLLDGDEPTLIDAGVGEPEHLEAIAAPSAAGRSRACS